jgi:hypothetical protein
MLFFPLKIISVLLALMCVLMPETFELKLKPTCVSPPQKPWTSLLVAQHKSRACLARQ